MINKDFLLAEIQNIIDSSTAIAEQGIEKEHYEGVIAGMEKLKVIINGLQESKESE